MGPIESSNNGLGQPPLAKNPKQWAAYAGNLYLSAMEYAFAASIKMGNPGGAAILGLAKLLENIAPKVTVHGPESDIQLDFTGNSRYVRNMWTFASAFYLVSAATNFFDAAMNQNLESSIALAADLAITGQTLDDLAKSFKGHPPSDFFRGVRLDYLKTYHEIRELLKQTLGGKNGG